jgi:hypothetical protein
MNTMGGVGGHSIDLNSVASPSFSADQRVECKMCELCGKGFFRPVLTMWRDCEACRTSQAAIAEERATVPPMNGAEEDYWNDPRRAAREAKRIAERALSLKVPA